MASKQHLGNVLVVSGCGFLCHHIVKQLLNSSPAVVSVLDLTVARNRFDNVSYTAADICLASEVNDVLAKEKPRIIHTALPVAHHHSGMKIYEKVNIEGTRTLLACAQPCDSVKAFVYTSSGSVVHDYVSDLYNADETFPIILLPEQHEPYAHTKGVADNLVLEANRANGDMLTCSIRPASMFGEGDSGTLVPMIEAAKAGKTKYQIGDGKNLFDFTYVGNAAECHILAASARLRTFDSKTPIPNEIRVDGEAFFVTNDEPMPFWDFTREVGAAAGYPVRKNQIWVIPRCLGMLIATFSEWIVWATSFGTKRPIMKREGTAFSCITRTYRVEKAKKRLGYNPKIKMLDGIRRGADWWLQTQQQETRKTR